LYVFCLGAACLPAYFAVSLACADWRLEGVRQKIEVGDPLAAVDDYREFVAAKPNGYYMDLWFSRQMVAAAESAMSETGRRELWSAAKEAAQRAAVESETPQNALYNLAFVASQEGDLQMVEQSLRAAIAAAPNWYQPYWMLAQVLGASGRLSEAIPLADRATELSGGNNAEVNAVRQSLEEAIR
jgi:tetratricopeptide (TPR) repeat protein